MIPRVRETLISASDAAYRALFSKCRSVRVHDEFSYMDDPTESRALLLDERKLSFASLSWKRAPGDCLVGSHHGVHYLSTWIKIIAYELC